MNNNTWRGIVVCCLLILFVLSTFFIRIESSRLPPRAPPRGLELGCLKDDPNRSYPNGTRPCNPSLPPGTPVVFCRPMSARKTAIWWCNTPDPAGP
ncbi:hypothetical protein ISN45_Aa08g028540 [Arabidopsis thaliana x Arabidopsis arenosa]|uniref:Uncharacterized protein n=2 Tax=Arabidopsis TaxID=3701 RepID=A0A8T1XSY4_9BRAS|nr:hypothetical protein ISN45_Aa08g028540 [Arabidopsis thaliana x Arabidopsis arenosa]